jgi:hypothetical protein
VTEGSKKAIIAAFFANLGIAISKFVGFIITGSAGMLAEAVHSLADTGNQGLLMLGGRRAKRKASPMHPFGFGRERYFWAFAVALDREVPAPARGREHLGGRRDPARRDRARDVVADDRRQAVPTRER